jgi:hypothetical protein
MELYPDALIGGIDHREGMAAEEVHVPEALRNAAVGHDDGDLMQSLRQHGPEIPVVVGRAHAGARVALDRVVQVREAQRIAEEEHRRVVADDVPVAFLGVELDGSAADVALGVGGAALPGHGREPNEHGRLLADLRENLRLGVAGDVVRDGEGAVRPPALGMHPALRDHLAVEMRQLLDQPDILQQGRTARPGCLNVEIVRDRRTCSMGQWRAFGFVVHWVAPVSVGRLATDCSCIARHWDPGNATALRQRHSCLRNLVC